MEGKMKKTISGTIFIIVLSSLHLYAQTWSALKRLTWNSGVSYAPSIATNTGNGIYVVWQDNSTGNREIFYKCSTDRGNTWSGNKRLTWNSGNSESPSIAVDSSNKIHVVWRDFSPGNYEIYYKRSFDGGITWSGITRLTWSWSNTSPPSIAVDSGNGIYLVYTDYLKMKSEIYYKRSTDGGITWSGNKRLTWNSGNSESPSIAVDPSNGIHVLWQDYTTGNYEIYYKQSTDGGITWSGITRQTWNSSVSYDSSIAADSSTGIHVVWTDTKSGNPDIYYRRSIDKGITWSAITRLTWNTGTSREPSITAASGSGIHVGWQDETPGNYEIYYKSSSNGGATWTALTRLIWNGSGSTVPALAADSSNGIHVVWTDETPGNYEIYYKNRK
jgi:hypothetical protein